MTTTLGLLPVIALSAGMAHAQTTEQDDILLDPIIVQGQAEAATNYTVQNGSSPKLTAPLLDTPKTITVITQRQMEERNSTSVLEVLRTTPGVTLGSGEGGTPMGDRPFVRGYQAATDMMVDGIRNLGRTSQEAFATESVEIAKGPGGAYSGRGATGGSINLVSKQAREGVTFHDFSATVGNGSQKRLTYDGNVDFGDGMAGRLNIMAQNSDVPGRDVLEDDRMGIAGAFSKRFGNSKVSLNAYHSKTEGTPDLGVPMANAAYLGIYGDRYGSGTKGDPFSPIEDASSDAFYGSALRDFREVENQSVMLKFEHEFSDNLRLHSTLAWIGSEQYYAMTRPTINSAGLVDRALRTGAKRNSGVAFQTALTGTTYTGSIKHDFAIGIEASNEKLRSASASGPAVGPTDIANPNPFDPVTGAPFAAGDFGAPIQTETQAVYIFDTVTFNDQWSLNLGLRYDHYDVNDIANERRRKDDMLNYSAGVVFKPAANGSIYAAIGTSSNPSGECAGMAGGADGVAACTLTNGNADLKPEESKSYELGTKWDLMNNQLMLSAAVFRTEKTNSRVADEFGNVSLQGETRAQGLELGAAGQITDRWGISAGYAYTDTELVDGGFDGGQPNPSNGNDLQFIAKHSLSVWSTYQATEQLTVGGGATYTGQRYLDDANTSALPSQWRVDAMAAYDFAENASVQFNVNNIFDERLYDASHVGLFANRAPGRSISAKLNYRF